MRAPLIILFIITSGINAFEFSKLLYGAKPSSLGGAFTALSDDLNAIDYNPAGLAQITRNQISSTISRIFEDISTYKFAFGLPIIKGKIATASSFSFLTATDQSYNSPTNYLGEIKFYGYKFDFTGALSIFKATYIGINLKFLTQKVMSPLNSNSLDDHGVDVGLIHTLPGKGESYGVSLKNIFSQFTDQTLNIGGVHKLINMKMLWDFTLTRSTYKLSLGFDYNFTNYIFIRLGVNFMKYFNITTGLGIEWRAFYLDYAFLPDLDLGSSHKVSFGAKF